MSVRQPLKVAIAVLLVALLAVNFVSAMRGQIELLGLAEQMGRLALQAAGGVSGASGASGTSSTSSPWDATSVTTVR